MVVSVWVCGKCMAIGMVVGVRCDNGVDVVKECTARSGLGECGFAITKRE